MPPDSLDLLSKLRIQCTPGVSTARPRSRRSVWIAGVLFAIGAAYFILDYKTGTPVETAAVSTVYPSQAYTLLNATGYVVAQRKASVGSKATGRLIWLSLREGSRVKEGEVLARIENRDVVAQSEQAAANVKMAQANLEHEIFRIEPPCRPEQGSQAGRSFGFVINFFRRLSRLSPTNA